MVTIHNIFYVSKLKPYNGESDATIELPNELEENMLISTNFWARCNALVVPHRMGK